MIKPEADLELSIKALEVYGVPPYLIEDMLSNLHKLIDEKGKTLAVQCFKLKLQERLAKVKEGQPWNEWNEVAKFGREDTLEEIIDMIDKDFLI